MDNSSASAYLRYRTWVSPPSSSGVSRWAISARSLSLSLLSPPISTLLVRASDTSEVVTGAPSGRGAWVSDVMTRTTSAADACSSLTTSISSSLDWSIRWIIRNMRSTFAARSEMISMLDPGWAAR